MFQLGGGGIPAPLMPKGGGVQERKRVLFKRFGGPGGGQAPAGGKSAQGGGK